MLNLVRNGELERWGAGPVPSFMAVQVTNTALSILDLSDARDWPARTAFGDRVSRSDRYVGEGMRSLRATVAAAAAVDAFRIHPLNVNALTWVGATVPVVSLTPGASYSLNFQCRCSTEGNLVRVRVMFRDIGGTVRLSLNSNDGAWAAAAGGGVVVLGTTVHWRRLAVSFVAPAADDAGNVIDNVTWQISNGTAAAQLLDLDDIKMCRADDQSAS